MRTGLRRVATLCLFLVLGCGTQVLGATESKSDRDKERNIDELKRFSQVLNIVERFYVNDSPRKDLIDGALKGMLQGLDPHSTLLSKDEFREMKETTSGEFFGIGIEITMEGNQPTVVTPIEDTPAHKAGLKPGDVILAVDDQPTMDMGLQDIVTRIRGVKGTEIELVIMHKGDKSPTTVRIKRDAIPLISVKARELEPGYYWIRLTRFSERTTPELVEALNDITSKGIVKGLVLDLRNNPGGLLDQAVSVSDVFLKDGVIVSMRGRSEQSGREFKATDQKTDATMPLVVLVNAGSASAAEIVAGALGDQKRAVLVGERTFGKGSVQNIIPMSDGSGVKLTVALYYTPSGRSIQAEGIEPDLLVPFEPSRKEDKPNLRYLREQDLRRHLEKGADTTGQDKDTPASSDKDKSGDTGKTGKAKGKKDAAPDKGLADLKSELTDTKDTSSALPDAKEFLEQDNQLRMGLQFVKKLPRLREIQ